ncbi:MAG: ZIP family metal transporter [Ruminococcaceae bacterium]|nr:ZIP family metal transporter [Oscillospiraceae bacterium]
MTAALITIILLPFFGTTLGAAWVFFLGKKPIPHLRQGLSGMAAGVMVAASVWSLILPALEQSAHLGKLACLPCLAGIWCGVLFLRALDRLIPWLHRGTRQGKDSNRLLTLAVTLHNLPEGMAVGVAAAGFLAGTGLPLSGVLTLSLGIALQNLPEGAIISMPMGSAGISRRKAFAVGTASGVVEPIGAFLTLLLAGLVVPILPFLLCFSAGAMLYVVVQELIPDLQAEEDFQSGALFFTAGFSVMMLLDVILG